MKITSSVSVTPVSALLYVTPGRKKFLSSYETNSLTCASLLSIACRSYPSHPQIHVKQKSQKTKKVALQHLGDVNCTQPKDLCRKLCRFFLSTQHVCVSATMVRQRAETSNAMHYFLDCTLVIGQGLSSLRASSCSSCTTFGTKCVSPELYRPPWILTSSYFLVPSIRAATPIGNVQYVETLPL